MNYVGMVATAVIGAAVVVGVVTAVKSVPDMKRYLRMRRM
ncbi:DUF6893 family small protein [Tsukamurella soli]|uniref:Uncharacterized protein n=1 Tax=Tsukamurella soli TaxID=644556 RepID=A0ABP8JF96_9ACTN